MAVTAKSHNEKMSKKLAQEHQLFLLWKNRIPPALLTKITTTTTATTKTTIITVRKK